ncbi:MAG: hypothetical protein IT372_16430 [Polyangiaceae bacterium]|nr:hypothetical protein [Polyangiaceae bacterium]
MKTSIALSVGVAFSIAVLSGCAAAPQGPRIRVATATPAEIEAVKDKDDVWFEFQPGDIVPVAFAFLGVAEGGSDQPALLRAKRQFFFVMSKDGPMRISFDGQTFAGPQSSQAVIGVMPRQGENGGQVGWIIYLGESGDVKAELESATREGAAAPPPK